MEIVKEHRSMRRNKCGGGTEKWKGQDESLSERTAEEAALKA